MTDPIADLSRRYPITARTIERIGYDGRVDPDTDWMIVPGNDIAAVISALVHAIADLEGQLRSLQSSSQPPQ